MGADTNSPSAPCADVACAMELPEEATIRAVKPQSEELADKLSRGGVRLTCEALTSIDTSFLQLIVSAKKTADATGQALTIEAPEGGILERAILRAGLQNELSGLIQYRAG